MNPPVEGILLAILVLDGRLCDAGGMEELCDTCPGGGGKAFCVKLFKPLR